MRGEQPATSVGFDQVEGSSPRARGAAHRSGRRAARPRIIPACAGSSWRRSQRGRRGPDHPRVRGEQPTAADSSRPIAGSSPRARGAGRSTTRAMDKGRIIPACAGSRASTSRRRRAGADHPRVRGEQTSASESTPRTVGSSPRARGAGTPPRPARRAARIIPACAGGRMRVMATGPAAVDHPRVRGEQTTFCLRVSVSSGSSPRARGAGRRHPRQLRPAGIIPACAGSRMPRT